jgi:hypothetical protein
MDEKFSSVAREELQIDFECHVVQKGIIIRTCHDCGLDLLDTVRAPPPGFVLHKGASHVEPEILDISYAVVSCVWAVAWIQFGVVRMINSSNFLKFLS